MYTSRPTRSAALKTAVLGLLSFSPLIAHAEEADPGDVGHAIVFVGVISIFFLCLVSFAVWLIVAQWRSRNERSLSELKPVAPQPNFERIWFPASASASASNGALPPTS